MKKSNKIIYWIATIWLSLGMVVTGVQQLLNMQVPGALAPPGIYGITQLGYPVYFLTLLGTWKILGVVAVLLPGWPLVKEWAYAGFFFTMSGAIYSHIAVGHAMAELVPSLLLLVLTLVSWYYRPAERRVVNIN